MDPFENARAFLNQIRSNLSKEDKPYLERLQLPNNLIKGEIELIMDNGKKKRFHAFRSQHNNILGPYKGGIRFHQNVSESEIKALALWMALKCSVAGIPLGGGKGGVIIDPKKLSQVEIERVSRAYVNLVAEHIGVNKDIPAPDVNTNPQIMAWMIDEYEKIIGHHEPGVFTGKPLEIGGSEGRTKATGHGGLIALRHLLAKLKAEGNTVAKKPRAHLTIAIQGFGNVGYFFAQAASDYGLKIVAVSDSKGGIHVEEGLDPMATFECKSKRGSVTKCYCIDGVCDLRKDSGYQITNEKLLELDVDILVPSALENVINKSNAKNIKAPIIIELANGPITKDADEILSKKGTVIIPDIYANSGGVIVSYLEWVQNRMGYYWKEAEIDTKLESLMEHSFNNIWNRYRSLCKKDTKATLREAAYLVAVERIIYAERLRRP